MQWRIGRVLFWSAIGMVAGSFVLALVGEETTSTTTQQALLHWHEWSGLGALVVLFAAFVVHLADGHKSGQFLPKWLPHFRATVHVALIALLVIQPISGWLLASHEGKLASFFGWTLPPIADPSNVLAEIGYIYHGIGGALIVLIAILDLRLYLTAWVRGLLRRSRRKRRARS